MKNNTLHTNHVTELLYQALETEKGGVQIYTTALRCAVNEELKKEWQKYLEQTKNHVQVVSEVLKSMGLDLETETPSRKVIRHIGTSLVKRMEMALRTGDPKSAQIVAAECVTLAETKDHINWSLIGELAKEADGAGDDVLKEAYDQVEDEEEEHLYPTQGLNTRALDRSAGDAGSASATRRRTGRDGNRSGTSQEGRKKAAGH